MKRLILGLSVAVMAGCASVSPSTYSVGSVGNVNRVVRAVVISARDVEIGGSESGAGAAAGAIAGGAAGSQAGDNAAGHIVGAVGGAVVGAIAGNLIESGATRQRGVEYVVQTETGALMTLVQGSELRFSVGAHVLVLYGDRSRLITDPAK